MAKSKLGELELAASGPAETAILKAIDRLVTKNKTSLPIGVDQLLETYLQLIASQEDPAPAKLQKEVSGKKLTAVTSCFKAMDARTIQNINRDIKKAFSRINNQDIYQSKLWKSYFNFKSIRVGIIFSTLIGMLVLRLSLIHI